MYVRILSDVLFYAAVAVILYSVISIDMSEGRVRSIMGYGIYTVMSSSMKDEIPKGSLIVVHEVDPAVLVKGDNITFLRGNSTTVTHKIIGISGNGAGSERRFQTKGVNNANPDEYTVGGNEIAGKVVFVIPGAGAVINSVAGNIHIVLIIFLLFSLLSFLLRGISSKKVYGRYRHETR